MSAPRKAEGLAEVAHDTYTVVLNLPRLEAQQSPYKFENEAFEIWQLIDGERTEQDMVAVLADRHGVDSDRIAASVRAFLVQLAELGLIVTENT